MKYKEHEKLAAVAEISQAQGEFLEWLRSEKTYREIVSTSIPDLLAEYHGIDQVKLEKEKRHMLAAMRKQTLGG